MSKEGKTQVQLRGPAQLQRQAERVQKKITVEASKQHDAKPSPWQLPSPSNLLFGTLIGTGTAIGTGVGGVGGLIALVVAEIYGLPNGFTGISKLKVTAIKVAATLGITGSALAGGVFGAKASKVLVALARDP